MMYPIVVCILLHDVTLCCIVPRIMLDIAMLDDLPVGTPRHGRHTGRDFEAVFRVRGVRAGVRAGWCAGHVCPATPPAWPRSCPGRWVPAVASASWLWPRPRPRDWRSASVSRRVPAGGPAPEIWAGIWPKLPIGLRGVDR